MKVSVNVTGMDLYYSGWAIFPKLKSTYLCMLMILIIAAVIILFVSGTPQQLDEWLYLLGKLLSIYFLYLLFIAAIGLIFCLFNYTNLSPGIGQHDYQITSEGLVAKTLLNEGLTRWEGVESIFVTRSHITYKLPGYIMHIIPKRCFESSKKCQSFIDSSKLKLKQAHSIIKV